MNRLAALALVGIFLLYGCRRAEDLSPKEVLRRATIKSGQLQSVEVVADIAATLPVGASRLSGTAVLRGVMTHGGEQAAFSVDAQGILNRGNDRSEFRWSADVVRDTDDTYLLVRESSADPPSAAPAMPDAILGTWWTLPLDSGNHAVRSLTPDPRFLRAQSEIIIIINDLGLEDVEGRNAYHYAVSIDHDRLVGLMRGLAEERGQPFSAENARRALERYDARGELWIDAETFAVRRISWAVVPKDAPTTMRLTLRMDLRNHDAATAVLAPAQSKPIDREFLPHLSAAVKTVSSLLHPWMTP